MTSTRPTLETIRSDIASALDADPASIEEGVNLMDLGLDSIRIMDLARRWSDATGWTVEFGVLAEEPELGAWWRYVEDRLE